MALIGRLIVIFFAFPLRVSRGGHYRDRRKCCIRNSAISGPGSIDQSAFNVVLGFGFIFIFWLRAAAGVDRRHHHRSLQYPAAMLAYALGGALVGAWAAISA
jgi:hypothetical protein